MKRDLDLTTKEVLKLTFNQRTKERKRERKIFFKLNTSN